MKRFKPNKAQAFVSVPLSFLQDPALSYKAKGVMCLLLGMGADEGIFPLLNSCTKEGRSVCVSAVKELVKRGYLLDEGTHYSENMERQSVRKLTQTTDESVRKVVETGRNTVQKIVRKGTKNIKKSYTLEQAEKSGVYNTRAITSLVLTKENKEKGLAKKKESTEDHDASLFPEQEHKPKLMRDSYLSEYEQAVVFFTDEEAAGVDIRHYHSAAVNWSDTGGAKNKPVKRTDRGWLATMRTFMLSDKKAGKLAMVGQKKPDLAKYFEDK